MLWNELTFAEYVIKRATSRWYYGFMFAACAIIYCVAQTEGPDMARTLAQNRASIFTVCDFFTLIMVIAVSATEIPGDIASKVIFIILSKPVDKSEIVVGKFLGVFGLGVLSGFIMWVVGMGCLWAYGLAPDAIYFQQGGFLFCRILLTAAIATLFSTFLSETPTIAFSVGYLVLSYFVHYIRVLMESGKIGYTVGTKIVFSLLYYMIPNMRFMDAPQLADAAPGSAQKAAEAGVDFASGLASWPHFGLALVYAMIYSGLLLFVAIRFFSSRRVA